MVISFLHDELRLLNCSRLYRPPDQRCLMFTGNQEFLYQQAFQISFQKDANKTNFHMKGFALGLVLKRRRKTAQKWAIQATVHPGSAFFF